MATIDVKPSWNTGTSQTYGDDGKVQFSSKQGYTIVASDGTLTADDVRRQAITEGKLPAPSSVNPDIPNQYVADVSVNQTSPIYFEATVSYKSPKLNPTDDEDTTPLDISTKVVWSTVETQAEIDEDVNGQAIETRNGEPISGITRNIYDLQATLTKNFLSFDPTVLRAFMHTTNTDTFLGFAPGQGLIKSVSATEQTYDETDYAEVITTILFRTPYNTTADKAWFKRIPHKGYLERTTTDADELITHAKDQTRQPVVSPVWLDNSGVKLEPGDAKTFLEFQVYPQTAFSNLGYF